MEEGTRDAIGVERARYQSPCPPRKQDEQQRASGGPGSHDAGEYNHPGRQGYLRSGIEKDPWNLIHLRAMRKRHGGPTIALATVGPV